MEKISLDHQKRVHPVWNMLILLAYAGIAALAFWLWHTHRLDTLHIWLQQAGPYAYLIYVGLYILLSLSFLPVMWLNLAAVTMFGPITGGSLIILSIMLASSATFFLSRTVLNGNWLQSKLGHPILRKLTSESHSWKTILFLRLSNAVPFSMINYLPGVMDIRFSNFMLATFIGSIPGTLVLAGLGSVVFKLLGFS